MTFGILLGHHENARYQQAVQPIAKAELQILLLGHGAGESVQFKTIAGVPWLCFETEELGEELARSLSWMSSLYLLCEMHPNGTFTPVGGRAAPFIGEDLPSILKYKGKTNTQFTQMMLNAAFETSRFSALPPSQIQVCDPICGRGTSLFVALNRGMHAHGVEIDEKDVKEFRQYVKRYFTYHKLKHKQAEDNLTIPGKGRGGAARTTFTVSGDGDAYKRGDTRMLSITQADTLHFGAVFKKHSMHVMVADLPYGVQHAPSARGKAMDFGQWLQKALPLWKDGLLPGGALAVSFNTYTLPRKTLKGYLERAGFCVYDQGPYGQFEHWVEQAVNRDLAVAVAE